MDARQEWARVRTDACQCRDCRLWQDATQTVFGEGPVPADLMFVGEQPGDREDVEGRPFVGPAGGLFDRALRDAGLDRLRIYVTNAVKHFKFERRGRRRIHKKPYVDEIAACSQWLQRETALVRPAAIVCLGATAAQAVLGRSVKIGEMRGRLLERPGAPDVLVTAHPSSVLRAQDDDARHAQYAALVADLRGLGTCASR